MEVAMSCSSGTYEPSRGFHVGAPATNVRFHSNHAGGVFAIRRITL